MSYDLTYTTGTTEDGSYGEDEASDTMSSRPHSASSGHSCAWSETDKVNVHSESNLLPGLLLWRSW